MFKALREDIRAVMQRDPAAKSVVEVALCYPSFHAVLFYRVANFFWRNRLFLVGRYISQVARWLTGIEIHPGATIGRRFFVDHGMGVVIGETAVVGDNVSMLHSVTLGGTGKEEEDRHPKIGDGVLIGAGAKVLGNIRIGHCSRIAAGSVVLSEVPPCKTVAGVPAKIVGEAGCDQPAVSMDQRFTDCGCDD